MEFEELRKKIIEVGSDYRTRNDIVMDKNSTLIKLFEEVGELSQAVLIHQNKCRKSKIVKEEESKKHLSEEMADAFCLIIMCANEFDVDLEDAIDKKWLSRNK